MSRDYQRSLDRTAARNAGLRKNAKAQTDATYGTGGHYFRKINGLWKCQKPGCTETRKADGRVA